MLQLLLGGYKTVVIDNLDNSSEIAVKRVKEIAGEYGSNLSFHKVDLRDKPAIEEIFRSNKFDAVIHFAGLKAVGESVEKPLMYYDNNLIGTITLLEVMAAHGCKSLCFHRQLLFMVGQKWFLVLRSSPECCKSLWTDKALH